MALLQRKRAVISFSGSGDNTVIAAVSGVPLGVYRIVLVVAGATAITFKSGSTALSGAMSLGANGSIALDGEHAHDPWFTCADGEAFVINSSNAVQVSGTAYYLG